MRQGYWMLSAVLSAGLAAGAAAAQETFDWPRLLVVGTPGTSSGSFASTNGWAPILQKEVGTTVRVVPEDSETQRYQRLTNRRDIALSSVSSAEMRYQAEGIDAYAAMMPVDQRIVWHHNDTPWGFVVSGDSDLQSLDDLKKGGYRVTEGLFSPPMMTAVRQGLPAYLGLSDEEAAELIEYVPASSYVENCRSVVEGKSDVAYCAAISSVLSEMEGAPGSIRWLPLEVDNVEGWQNYLNARPMLIPAEISMGVETARGVGGAISNFVYAMPADADADLVYNLATFFGDSHDAYKGTHPLAARMSMEEFRKFLDRSPLPVHEGTVRYLEEIGAWSEEDQAANEAAIAKMEAWTAARMKALEEARAEGVRPDASDPAFMEIMERNTEGLEGFRSRL